MVPTYHWKLDPFYLTDPFFGQQTIRSFRKESLPPLLSFQPHIPADPRPISPFFRAPLVLNSPVTPPPTQTTRLPLVRQCVDTEVALFFLGHRTGLSLFS